MPNRLHTTLAALSVCWREKEKWQNLSVYLPCACYISASSSLTHEHRACETFGKRIHVVQTENGDRVINYKKFTAFEATPTNGDHQ